MEMTSYLQAGAGLLLVLGLIALAAFIARKLGYGGGGRWRDDRRLSVVETMTLDPKRRVLLIKCDDTEHLVLLGSSTETVLSGRTPERQVYQAPVANTGTSENSARPPAISTSGPSMLTKEPSTWTSPRPKQDSALSGRREPQLGPIPKKPK